MITTISSIKIVGTKAVPITIECSIESGIGIHLVGLADAAVKESLLRTVTALQAKGYHIPGKRIIINLSPSDLYKEGCGYDLPIALSIIAASKQETLPVDELGRWIVVGELGLDASIRNVPEAYQAASLAVTNGYKGVIVPEDNLPAFVELLPEGAPVYPVKNLEEALLAITHPDEALKASDWYERLLERKPDLGANQVTPSQTWDLIRGNDAGKRAVEIAAAGRHNILFIGAPGSNKGLLARSLANLLPPMSLEEASEVAGIYSADGRNCRLYDDVKKRPFRAPHISASIRALFGGGAADRVGPGEVSLAHNGVLFLDEFAEAPKVLGELLRAPMEDKQVVISRLRSKVSFPSDFILALASNPCPCGYYGEGERCTCTPGQRDSYLSRLSGPVMDRVSVQAWCHPPRPEVLLAPPTGESFHTVSERVAKATAIQRKRYAAESYKSNEDIPAKDIDRYCPLTQECKVLVEKIMTRLGLSARAYSRIIKIARTIADLEGKDDIEPQHLAEASSYRFLDRKNLFNNDPVQLLDNRRAAVRKRT